MKKIINKKTYNTDTAEVISKACFGEFGEVTGYEEMLYKTKKGDFFLFGNGGEESKYKQEDIFAISEDDANDWAKRNA